MIFAQQAAESLHYKMMGQNISSSLKKEESYPMDQCHHMGPSEGVLKAY